MDKDNIIELTTKLYKMTLLFPKKEPLRYKMREIADEVLAEAVALEVFHSSDYDNFGTVEKTKKEDLIFFLEKDLEILKSYFEVVKWQNWVSYFDVLNLEEEYDKIKGQIQPVQFFQDEVEKEDKIIPLPASVPSPLIKEASIKDLDYRKEKILGLLKERGRVQVWEVSKVFPEVSKRTLRRDFVQLLELGLIERIGQRNDTFYKLKTQEV